MGRAFVAEDVKLGHLDEFRSALEGRWSVGYIGKAITDIKTVFRWAERRELVSVNKTALYRHKVAKEERPEPPAEYSSAEREAIVAALSPQRATEWRAWAAVMIAAHQGARMRAILQLRWEDLDLERGEVTWRARWAKQGRTWGQPLTDAAYSAILTARYWADRDLYFGGWLLYSSHHRKRNLGDDPRAVYHVAALEYALRKAEVRANVEHKPNRAMHGFRRTVAGDVAELTGDIGLAMDFIGDRDFKMAARYIKRRDTRLQRAVELIDARNRPQTGAEVGEPRRSDEEVVEDADLAGCAREDSNLRPTA